MSDIDEQVREVLEDETEGVRDYRTGAGGAKNYLIGRVMAETGGRTDPAEAAEAIDRVLEEDEPEWPVTFSLYSRPTDKTAIAERLWNHIPRWTDGPMNVTGAIPEFEFLVTVTQDGDFELTFAGWDDD